MSPRYRRPHIRRPSRRRPQFSIATSRGDIPVDGGSFSRSEASHPRNTLAFPRAVRSSEYGRLRGDTLPFAQSAAMTRFPPLQCHNRRTCSGHVRRL